MPRGTTATTHILKPQIGQLPNGIDLTNSVENEYLCLKLAAALGLPAANVEIIDFAGKRALVVERFDRQWTRDMRLLRLPQEDCCQCCNSPSRKYESEGGPGMRDITALLKGSDTPEVDLQIFFKAQIVFWNTLARPDGHAKNFSVRLAPGGRYRLALLHDIISTQPSFYASRSAKIK